MSTTTQPWYVVRAKTAIAAASQGVAAAAEIYIYGDIGESWYEETVSASQFVRDLNALNVDAITVRINCLGGSVPDGLAIYNAMKRHRATITVEVDAIAYSIASLIAMGGDQIHMASNALLMIHAPWTGVYGNSTDLREMADQLDTWAAAMSTSYAAKTGDQPAMLALLTDGKDHFYTAEAALAAGFIDAPVVADLLRALIRLTAALLDQRGRDIDPVVVDVRIVLDAQGTSPAGQGKLPRRQRCIAVVRRKHHRLFEHYLRSKNEDESQL